MGKLIVEIPDSYHRDLKRRAAIQNRTIKQVVTELVADYLAGPEDPSRMVDGTGLCGKWEDDRTPEEIIADIKRHRRWFQDDDG